MARRSPSVYRRFCQVLMSSGFVSLFRGLNRYAIPILMYHGLREDDSPDELTTYRYRNVLADEFRTQMALLRQHYTVYSLSQVIEALGGGRALNPYCIALTFDDGYLSTYTHAWPICRDLEIPFTLFVVTDSIENGTILWPDRLEMALTTTTRPALEITINGTLCHFPLRTIHDRNAAILTLAKHLKASPAGRVGTYLEEVETKLGVCDVIHFPTARQACTWNMLREMAGSGLVEIGSHTARHSILTTLSRDEAARELRDSKRLIEERLGLPCQHFSYPNGKPADFSPDTKALVRRSGYCSAVTTVEGFNHVGNDPFTLRRFGVGGHYVPAEFFATITGLHGYLARHLGRAG